MFVVCNYSSTHPLPLKILFHIWAFRLFLFIEQIVRYLCKYFEWNKKFVIVEPESKINIFFFFYLRFLSFLIVSDDKMFLSVEKQFRFTIRCWFLSYVACISFPFHLLYFWLKEEYTAKMYYYLLPFKKWRNKK